VSLDDVEGQRPGPAHPGWMTRSIEVSLKRFRGADRMAFALRASEILAEMMANEPGGYLVGQALEFYLERGFLLADVHWGNIGLVKRDDHSRPVPAIIDPGHAIPLRPEADTVTVEAA
jgi:hypothetical protein